MESPKAESCKSALSFISAAYQDEQSEDEGDIPKSRKTKHDKKHKKHVEQLQDSVDLEVLHKYDKYETCDKGSVPDESVDGSQSKKGSRHMSDEHSSSKSSKILRKSREEEYYEESYHRSRERDESPQEKITAKKHKQFDIDNEYAVETVTSRKHRKSEDEISGKKQRKSKVTEDHYTKDKEEEEQYPEKIRDKDDTQRHTRSSKYKYKDDPDDDDELDTKFHPVHSGKTSKKHKHKKQYEVDYEYEKEDIVDTVSSTSHRHRHKHDKGKKKHERDEYDTMELDGVPKSKSKDYYTDESYEPDHLKLKIKKKKKSTSKVEEDVTNVDEFVDEFSHKEKLMRQDNIFENVKSEFGEPSYEKQSILDDKTTHKVNESGEHGKIELQDDKEASMTRVKAALESILKANDSKNKTTVLDIPMPDTIPLPPEPVKAVKPPTKVKDENVKSATEVELPSEPRRSKRKKQRRFSDYPDPPDILQPSPPEVPPAPPAPLLKPQSPLEKLQQQPQLTVKIEDFHKVSPSKSPKKSLQYDIPTVKLSDPNSITSVSKKEEETVKPLNKISFSIKTKFPKLKRPTGEEAEVETEPKRETHHDPEIKQLSNLKFKITNILGMKETGTSISQPETRLSKAASSSIKEEIQVDKPQTISDSNLDEVFELRKDVIKPKLLEAISTESVGKIVPPVAKDKAFMPRIFTVKPVKTFKQAEPDEEKTIPAAEMLVQHEPHNESDIRSDLLEGQQISVVLTDHCKLMNQNQVKLEQEGNVGKETSDMAEHTSGFYQVETESKFTEEKVEKESQVNRKDTVCKEEHKSERNTRYRSRRSHERSRSPEDTYVRGRYRRKSPDSESDDDRRGGRRRTRRERSPRKHFGRARSPRRRSSRERSPRRYGKSPSRRGTSRDRSSPRRHSSRDKSPVRRHSSRDKSPPRRYLSRERSQERSRERRHASREKSPRRQVSRERSPRRHKSRDRSPKRHASREDEPRRYRRGDSYEADRYRHRRRRSASPSTNRRRSRSTSREKQRDRYRRDRRKRDYSSDEDCEKGRKDEKSQRSREASDYSAKDKGHFAESDKQLENDLDMSQKEPTLSISLTDVQIPTTMISHHIPLPPANVQFQSVCEPSYNIPTKEPNPDTFDLPAQEYAAPPVYGPSLQEPLHSNYAAVEPPSQIYGTPGHVPQPFDTPALPEYPVPGQNQSLTFVPAQPSLVPHQETSENIFSALSQEPIRQPSLASNMNNVLPAEIPLPVQPPRPVPQQDSLYQPFSNVQQICKPGIRTRFMHKNTSPASSLITVHVGSRKTLDNTGSSPPSGTVHKENKLEHVRNDLADNQQSTIYLGSEHSENLMEVECKSVQSMELESDGSSQMDRKLSETENKSVESMELESDTSSQGTFNVISEEPHDGNKVKNDTSESLEYAVNTPETEVREKVDETDSDMTGSVVKDASDANEDSLLKSSTVQMSSDNNKSVESESVESESTSCTDSSQLEPINKAPAAGRKPKRGRKRFDQSEDGITTRRRSSRIKSLEEKKEQVEEKKSRKNKKASESGTMNLKQQTDALQEEQIQELKPKEKDLSVEETEIDVKPKEESVLKPRGKRYKDLISQYQKELEAAEKEKSDVSDQIKPDIDGKTEKKDESSASALPLKSRWLRWSKQEVEEPLECPSQASLQKQEQELSDNSSKITEESKKEEEEGSPIPVITSTCNNSIFVGQGENRPFKDDIPPALIRESQLVSESQVIPTMLSEPEPLPLFLPMPVSEDRNKIPLPPTELVIPPTDLVIPPSDLVMPPSDLVPSTDHAMPVSLIPMPEATVAEPVMPVPVPQISPSLVSVKMEPVENVKLSEAAPLGQEILTTTVKEEMQPAIPPEPPKLPTFETIEDNLYLSER